eukprot:1545527-Pyramimonas_sp.AAC.1
MNCTVRLSSGSSHVSYTAPMSALSSASSFSTNVASAMTSSSKLCFLPPRCTTWRASCAPPPGGPRCGAPC